MRGMDGTQLKLKAGQRSCNVKLNYLGQHNVANARWRGGVDARCSAQASRGPPRVGQKPDRFPMRMQSEDWRGLGIINDAYNANPLR